MQHPDLHILKGKFRPRKSLGQNFLIDENVARKIVSRLNLTTDDCVLEIGSGQGVLTKYLIQVAGKVVAVEIDKYLVQQLIEYCGTAPNLILYHGDILKISFAEILTGSQEWKVVANLPYHITSPVLFKLFDQRHFFTSATLMVQKEVAQRIGSRPDSKDYGILSVLSQFYADARVLFTVSQQVFYPRPDVVSAVVQLVFKKVALLDEHAEVIFRRIVRGTFNQRRKMLRNSLMSIPDLKINFDSLNFDLKQRPEQLSVSDFIELTKQIVGQVNNTRPIVEANDVQDRLATCPTGSE